MGVPAKRISEVSEAITQAVLGFAFQAVLKAFDQTLVNLADARFGNVQRFPDLARVIES